jgi:co-chaperonin GroES (HSP10)
MIKPLLYRVLLKYESVYDIDPAFLRAKKAGLALAEDHEDMQRRNAGIDKGTVVAVGPDAKVGDLKAGDRVGFAKHSGKIVIDESDDKKYLILNDEDILYIQR